MILLLILCPLLGVARAQEDPAAAEPPTGERILAYTSEITIQPDSTLTVAETIQVNAERQQINHGIYRDFPTRFATPDGRVVRLGFELLGCYRDGHPEPYHTEGLFEGLRIYLGDGDVELEPGVYAYQIRYRVNRILTYHESYDELYWNVTGNAWNFPIDTAMAAINLPQPVDPGRLVLEGYTGPYGSTGQAYTSLTQPDGTITFQTTQPLQTYEGFTVRVRFPKGLVRQPTQEELFGYWLKDHRGDLVGVVGVLLLLSYYLWAWSTYGRDPRAQSIAPYAQPPEGVSPATARYLRTMSADSLGFTAAITSMAAKGYLRIMADEKSNYIIERTGEDERKLDDEEHEVAIALFAKSPSVPIDREYQAELAQARTALAGALRAKYYGKLFTLNMPLIAIGISFSIVVLILMVVCAENPFLTIMAGVAGTFLGIFVAVASYMITVGRRDGLTALWQSSLPIVAGCATAIGVAVVTMMFLIVLLSLGPVIWTVVLTAVVIATLVALNALFWFLLPCYTVAGRAVLNQLEGLRRTLSGEDRRPYEGSTLTQEAFEALLPFAIALGVQGGWAKQMEQALTASQQPTAPRWYYNPYAYGFDYHDFSNNLARNFTNSYSTASTPASSGSGGGGGSSGGGGGGGGGGGW